jgi:hypothetical protein
MSAPVLPGLPSSLRYDAANHFLGETSMATPAPAFVEWLKTRPECVQKLAEEFPLGSKIDVAGIVHYLIGYTEDDRLVISPIDPSEDYDASYELREHLCADHLRGLPS